MKKKFIIFLLLIVGIIIILFFVFRTLRHFFPFLSDFLLNLFLVILMVIGGVFVVISLYFFRIYIKERSEKKKRLKEYEEALGKVGKWRQEALAKEGKLKVRPWKVRVKVKKHILKKKQEGKPLNKFEKLFIGDVGRNKNKIVSSICPFCGAPLDNDSIYCKYCGSKADGRSRYISPDIKRKVWKRDKGRCVNCGSRENLEFDHIIPLSKGGSNSAKNIQLLCEKCNREKGNKIGI